MRLSQTGDVWWKSAVFYCADVETFQDSDGDGIGDLRGMTERLEYLADLGVTEFFLGIRTDVRVDGLIMGCLAAVLWAYGLVPGAEPAPRQIAAIRCIVAVSLAHLLWAAWRTWDAVRPAPTRVDETRHP